MLIRAATKPNQPTVLSVTSLLQGLKRVERGADHQPSPSTGLQMGQGHTSPPLCVCPQMS